MASRFDPSPQGPLRESPTCRLDRSRMPSYDDEAPSHDHSHKQRASAVSAFVNDFLQHHTARSRVYSGFPSSSARARAPVFSGELQMSRTASSRAPSYTRERPSHVDGHYSRISTNADSDNSSHIAIRQARDDTRSVEILKVAPLRVGLGHLRQAYEEARLHYETLTDGFDAAIGDVRAFAGSKAIRELWYDYLREERSSSVGINAKLSSVQYCLNNIEQQGNREGLPRAFDKLIHQTVNMGQDILELSNEAKVDRRAADRLISALRAASADVDPSSGTNKCLFLELDPFHARSSTCTSTGPAAFSGEEKDSGSRSANEEKW